MYKMKSLVTVMGAVLCAGALMLTPGTAHAQECVVTPDGLVSWWPADGSADDIQGGNDGALIGGTFATSVVTSGTGEAFSFDGIDDYVIVPHHSSLNFTTSGDDAVTVSLWVRVDGYTLGDGANHLGLSGKDGDAYYTGMDGNADPDANEWGLFTRGGNMDSADCSTPTLGVWYHYTAIYDEGNDIGQIYINGTLDCSATITDDSDGSTDPFYIGSTTTIAFFHGLIDEVTVFDRVLSPAEIQAMADAGSSGLCKDEDGDGYRPPEDCDETDPTVNPDGLELPGNFLDENCDGDLSDCYPCLDWQNHGKYVRCVAHAVNDLVDAGVITEDEGDALVSSAAQSDIGKQGYTPPQCQ